MNRLQDVMETLLSFSKYVLSNTFSQNINYCSVAFSLLFSIVLLSLFEKILFITCDQKESLKRIFIYFYRS